MASRQMAPDIALAASAREWPDRLHRFLLDHGGGRIVDRVMTADQATDAVFDVLFIDDVCSFLTPRLVRVLTDGGAEIIGVFAPEDGTDAKRRLLECGISDVIETEASPEEFLEKAAQTLEHHTQTVTERVRRPKTRSIAVTGPSEGVGMTEVSLALALALSKRIATVLLDLDQVWPSIAQRLDLSPHPNIRTAIDHAIHSPERLLEAVHDLDELRVVGGRADGGQGPAISRHESAALIDSFGATADVVVADLGPLAQVEGGLTREFDTVIVVGTGGPIGVARLIRTIGDLVAANEQHAVLAVVNRPGRGAFQTAEVLVELESAFEGLPVVTLPFDRRLADSVWDGRHVSGRGYGRAVGSMADVVVRSLQ